MDTTSMDLARRGPPRASPLGRPPRVLRSGAAALGLALVAALDGPQRARSDSTVSSDTFDGIYALGDDEVGAVDVDDVDMDDLQCVDADADAFRPSALLDRKLEDEFGRASDLERMLSSLDGGAVVDVAVGLTDVHGMEVDEDEATAVMAHLAQLDAQQHKMASALPGALQLLPAAHGARHVVVQPLGSVESAEAATAALPPRVAPSETKRRVHRRTFGERAATFRFGGVASPSSTVKVSAATAATTIVITSSTRSRTTTTTVPTTTRTATRRARSLFHEAAEDIAGRRDVATERDDKENAPPGAGSTGNDDASRDRLPSSLLLPVEAAQMPVRAELPVTASDVSSASFHTPLRRSASVHSTSTTASSASVFLTPIVPAPSSASSVSTALACAGAISPAPTFDKVAVVHAKDTPGKVDKFEWTIGRSTSPTPDHAVLPPPYLRDASATPKRRVHSSTFGSFARSFSFTTP